MVAAPSDYIQRLEGLLEIGRSLGANLDSDALLQTVVDAACDLLGGDDAILLLKDETSEDLRILAGTDSIRFLRGTVVPRDGSAADWVFTRGKTTVIANAAQDPRVAVDLAKKYGYDLQRLLAMPLIFKDQTLGVLEVLNCKHSGEYSEADLWVAESLAGLAAVAIQTSRLADVSSQAFEKLEELDRMKSDFIAITSHELRTPVGLILGHATFLRENAHVEDAAQLDVIVRSAMRLKEIIEEFSQADNLQSGLARIRSRQIGMGRLILDVVNTFQIPAAEKHISLLADVSLANLVVEGDAEKIHLALTNLVKNAVMFTPEGGHVLVSAEPLPGFVKVSVADDGVGIPASELQRVFERFYQVENHLTRKHGGVGLGLALAKDMVEMHGGRIWVESTEGQGSIFSFLLPTNAEQVSAARAFLE